MNGLHEELLVALHGVWKRRWIALGVGWAIALAGWLAISLIPNKYESQARILVSSPSLMPDSVGLTPADRQRGIDAVRQTLTSTVNLEQVVRGTDLANQVASDRDVADRAQGLAKNIKVIAEQDNLFQITAASGDASLSDAANARLSRQIAQKLIDSFIDGSLAGTRAESGQTLKFLDAQINARARQLAEVESKRNAFAQRYMALLPGSGTIADRIDAARAEMARIDSDLSAAQASLAAVNGQLASTPASTRTPGALIPGAPSAGAGIQAQIAEGRARGWTDEHPDMVALRSQLARMGGSGGGARMSAPIVTPNPMYMSLRSMQAEKQAVAGSLAARKAQLQGSINAVIAAQASDPAVAEEQTRLDRDYQVLKDQYDKLVADREQAKLKGQVQTQAGAVKYSVIDPPSAPRVPASPNRPLLLTLVLFAAIAGGAGAAFAMGQMQASYPTASRLARASGLPVIGSISEVLNADARSERARRNRLFAGGAAALAGVWAVLMTVEFVQRAMVA